jgi:hypothetical protein
MKTSFTLLKSSKIIGIIVLFMFGISYSNAQELDIDKTDTHKPETELPPDVIWDVKAYMPEAKLIKVKAVDEDGKLHDVKALQSFGDTSILDVKCLYNDEVLPVKLILGEGDNNYALKAIKEDGTLLSIVAVTDEGEQFQIKGIKRIGNIVNIRVLGKDGTHYKVFAISPEGHVNDVKGIKMLRTEEETVVNGVSVYAHVKALTQI